MRLYSVFIFTTSFALFGLGSSFTKVNAQTTYPFEAIYNVETVFRPITSNIFETTDTAENVNAPYGLTNIINKSYLQAKPNNSGTTFGPNASMFGLQGFPILTFTFFGQASDTVFATISGSNTIDTENLVGVGNSIITITGGEGRFKNAIGKLDLKENIRFSADPTAPINSTWFISGSFQTVPEPKTNAALISMSVILLARIFQKDKK